MSRKNRQNKVTTNSNGDSKAENGFPSFNQSRMPFNPALGKNANDLDRLEYMVMNVTSMRSELFRKFMDPRRNINDECGYPATGITNADAYRALYDREPIATRVVQLMSKESWQVTPEVFESNDGVKSTKFEEAWDNLAQQLRGENSAYADEQGSPVWEHLQRVNMLSGIGHFGVLLLGLDDGKNLQDPVDGSIEIVKNESYMLETEEKRLRDLPKLTANESATIDWWKNQREITLNKVAEVKDLYDRSSASGDLSGTDQQYYGVQFGPSEQPAKKAAKKDLKLLFLRSFDESLVQIVRYEWNIRSPRFGQPVIYRITLNDPREQHSGVGLPLATVFVHWSRVIHVADNLGGSEIFGVPRMRPVLNAILDVQKVRGGSAEMYWRGAFPGFSLETHPQLGGDVDVDKQANKDMMEQYMNGLQRYISLMGMSAKSLAPQVVDPTPQIQAQIEAICIQLGCPIRVFKGSERGELASSQDDASWNDRVKAYQNNYLTPRLIVPFIDRLILIGVLPEVEEYHLKWPDINALNDMDKANIAGLKATAVSTWAQGGGNQMMADHDFWTRIMGESGEDADEIIEAAEEHKEEMDKENQALADEHGMIPEAPPGFQHPEPPPPPVPGAPPVKLRPGERLVNPRAAQSVGQSNNPVNPVPPKKPVANENPKGCNQYKHCDETPAAIAQHLKETTGIEFQTGGNHVHMRGDDERTTGIPDAMSKIGYKEHGSSSPTVQTVIQHYKHLVSGHEIGVHITNPTWNFNPDEARDKIGRWTKEGIAAGKVKAREIAGQARKFGKEAVAGLKNMPTHQIQERGDQLERINVALDVAGLLQEGPRAITEALKETLGSDIAEGNIAKLPPILHHALAGSLILGGAMSTTLGIGWAATEAFAARIGHERGLDHHQAERLKAVLKVCDHLTSKPLMVGLAFAGLHPVAAAAALIPPATATYIAYNAVRHPLATFRAAKAGIVHAATQLGLAGTLGIAGISHNSEDARNLEVYNALAAHDFEDWYMANLLAGLSFTANVEDAIKLANEAYAQQSTDNSIAKHDDADAVFGEQVMKLVKESV